jgi:hypothetical protein
VGRFDLHLGLDHAPVQAGGVGWDLVHDGPQPQLGQLGLCPVQVLVLFRPNLGDSCLDGRLRLTVGKLFGQLTEQLPVGVILGLGEQHVLQIAGLPLGLAKRPRGEGRLEQGLALAWATRAVGLT